MQSHSSGIFDEFLNEASVGERCLNHDLHRSNAHEPAQTKTSTIVRVLHLWDLNDFLNDRQLWDRTVLSTTDTLKNQHDLHTQGNRPPCRRTATGQTRACQTRACRQPCRRASSAGRARLAQPGRQPPCPHTATAAPQDTSTEEAAAGKTPPPDPTATPYPRPM